MPRENPTFWGVLLGGWWGQFALPKALTHIVNPDSEVLAFGFGQLSKIPMASGTLTHPLWQPLTIPIQVTFFFFTPPHCGDRRSVDGPLARARKPKLISPRTALEVFFLLALITSR